MHRLVPTIDGILRLELRRAVLWLPVLMGIGIWLYLSWPEEPPVATALLPLLPTAVLFLLPGTRRQVLPRTLLLGMMALLVGHTLALLSARGAEMPRLPGPVHATVGGRVVALDTAASGSPRVLLDDVIIYGRDPADTPGRVRVTLLDTRHDPVPRPGERVLVQAILLPPGVPVEPGGFDFAKRAFFERIGAIGYARTPALRVPAEEAGRRPGLLDRARIGLAAFRHDLAEAIRRAVPGAEGGFAAAIIVGDRSGIAETDKEALRISSLAHLLAISGLHMGMLTGLVFAGIRLGLALSPAMSFHLPVKKIAALAALVAGLAYLLISGGTVATQRAFVMVSVMFVAVLLDRPAISLRALALAAAIVLAARPMSLLDAGFQMSFAATIALVAAYEEVRRRRPPWRPAGGAGRAGRFLRMPVFYAGALLFTSLVAGLATAPYSGFHFNRLAPYGLIANLGAVPAMGLWIAPMAVLSALAAPFGLAEPALEVMGRGIGWVLRVAHWTANLPGADRPLVAAPEAVLALISLGGLWLAIWRGPWRLLGAAPVALALLLWQQASASRPALLISPAGSLIGALGPAGRVLDSDRVQSYAAETWLRRDGDIAEQPAASLRPGLDGKRRHLNGQLGDGWRFMVVRGGAELPEEACSEHWLLISTRVDERPKGACVFLGKSDLHRLGAVAVTVRAEGLTIIGSAPSGRRPWMAPR